MAFLLDIHTRGYTAPGATLSETLTLRAPNARRSKSGLMYAISGLAVLGGKLVGEGADVAEPFLRQALSNPSSGSIEMRGAAALFIYDPVADSGVVISDTIGACHISIFRDKERTLIATDLELLRLHLQESGVTLQKSGDHIANKFITGFGGLGSSPYVNVQIIELGHYVSFKGAVHRIKEVDLESLYQDAAETNYKDGVERIRAEISENIEALQSHRELSPIAHLTGGADSRLVLSFLVAAGVHKDYLYYCSGHPGERDRLTFEALARDQQLTSSSGSGISTSRHPESFKDQAIAPLKYSSGLLTAGPTEHWIKTGNLILAGGYGETLRSFWGRPEAATANLSGRALMNILWLGNLKLAGADRTPFLKEDAIERIATAVDSILDRGRRIGLSADANLDFLYLARARMFVGTATYLQSNFLKRVDPLYSPFGMFFTLSRPLNIRKSNIIGFDLMEANSPDLARLPFDTPRFNPDYLALRAAPRKLGFRRQEEPLRVGDPVSMPSADRSRYRTSKPTEQQIAFAMKHGASLRQVTNAETVRNMLQSDMRSLDNSTLGSTFNVHAIEDALATPFDNRVLMRGMTTLHALIGWFAQ